MPPLARKQLEEIAAADSELDNRVHAYREGMIPRLGNEIVESRKRQKEPDALRKHINVRTSGRGWSGSCSL